MGKILKYEGDKLMLIGFWAVKKLPGGTTNTLLSNIK